MPRQTLLPVIQSVSCKPEQLVLANLNEINSFPVRHGKNLQSNVTVRQKESLKRRTLEQVLLSDLVPNFVKSE